MLQKRTANFRQSRIISEQFGVWVSIAFSLELMSAPAPLAEIFGSERADAFQGEREQDARFVTESGVECHVLDVQAATIPGPSGRGRQIDENPLSRSAREKSVAQVVADCKAAVWAARRIAHKCGDVELVAGESGRIVAKLIRAEFINFDAARVIPGLAERKESL